MILQEAIYNFFGSGIFHKPHSIFKLKSYEFHNRNIGLFSSNDTKMEGYFIGVHRDLHTKKVLLTTISSAGFISISLDLKLSQVLSYITDETYFQPCYILLNILFPCLRVLCLEDSTLAGIYKLYYYYLMTNIHIQTLWFS